MATEGIMALPQGMGMEGEQAQQQQPTVTSADSYDAAMTALGMARPGEDAALKEAIRQNIGDLQLTPAQLDVLIQVFTYVSQNPGDYKNLLQKMIEGDALDEGDMPAEYDPEFIGAMLAVLQEMRQMQGAGAQEPMDMSPVVEGLQPVGMASGGLADVGQYLAAKGRGGDSILAHITPEEAAMLKRRGGSGTINPATGLPEFKGGVIGDIVGGVKDAVKSVVNTTKDVLKSPVGRILTTVALATVLGPAGMQLSMGTAAGLAGAGSALLGGGDLKDALISGAMGYIGGGGTVFGTSPLSAVGSYLPGAAGSALNTGLTTGLLGAGIGRLGGMSEQDALRMGLISGAAAGATRGLQNYGEDAYRNAVKLDGPSPIEQAGVNAPGAVGPTGAVGTAQDLINASDLAAYPSSPVDIAQANSTPLGLPPGAGPDIVQPANYAGALELAPNAAPEAGYNVASGGSNLPPDARGGYAANSVPGMANPRAPYLGELTPIPNTPPPGTQFPFPNTPPPGTQLPFPNTPPPGQGVFPPDYSQTDLGSKTPIPNTPPPGYQPPSYLDRAISGTKNLYNEYLSPSRPGLAADAGIFTKYGPLAAVGTGVAYLAGAMDSEPVKDNPAFDRKYTGNEYIRDNPQLFSGGLGSYTRPSAPASPIVPTPSYGSIPIGQPGNVIPTGITNRPGGVAQPYNVAGLYGVPLVYGPDGQLRRMAKGGDAKMTDFPRRQGPINGPGTGTSDDIPAMLSDGEFVFTAKAVRNAGGGSRRKGAARMYKLMKKLEGGAVKGN
jgi:hypothetical protein